MFGFKSTAARWQSMTQRNTRNICKSTFLRHPSPKSTNKIFPDAKSALSDVKSGSLMITGGFGICGICENSLNELQRKGITDLTFATNTCGMADYGPGMLSEDNQVKKYMMCYAGENKAVESLYLKGEIELEFIPQGSLVERMRAAYAGIPAWYTATAMGTWIQEGGFPSRLGAHPVTLPPRETKEFGGRSYVMEEAIYGDVVMTRAYIGDKHGNLRMRKTARNFNQDIAGAGSVTVAEVEYIVDELPPDQIHVCGNRVDRVFKGRKFEKRCERVRVDTGEGVHLPFAKGKADKRLRIVQRTLQEVKDGMYINLGIGIPSITAALALESPSKYPVDFQCENGIVGMGPYPKPGNVDPDLVNASKESITDIPGTSYSSSAETFGMIRGGHLHTTILGALQVDSQGNIANWIIPGVLVKGMGGAMDLCAGGGDVIVCMEHCSSQGELKVLDKCTLPFTAKGVIKKLITDMAVFEWGERGEMVLTELAPGVTLEELRECTTARFVVAQDIHVMHNVD